MIETRLAKMYDTRGHIRNFGEYVGRIAEAVGAKGIGIDYGKARPVSGIRYHWQSIGDGVNQINNLIWKWAEDGKPKTAETDSADAAIA
jgi:hypothetical protein